MDTPISRRDLIKLFSAAAFAAPLALPAYNPGAPLYFTPDEFTLLDTLAELIIPADDHSPGAHAAEVAAYIDKSVSQSFLPEQRTSWRKGLASVNTLSESLQGKPFLQLAKKDQIAVLDQMSTKEGHEGHAKHSEVQGFFGQLKQTVVFAYYTTSIGIHQEINYKGNVLLEHFVGYMPDDPLPPISSLANA